MKYYTVKDDTRSITGWAERVGISRQAMTRRIAKTSTDAELICALTERRYQGRRTDVANKSA